MSANPLQNQGTLNRIRASVEFALFPQLNITSSFLAKAGISMRLTGESVEYLPTMTGAVTSPNAYLMIEAECHIVKSTALSDAFKIQMELQSTLGNCTITPDTAALGVYQILNSSISSIPDVNFAGESPDYTVIIRGYYLVNSTLFNLN